MNRCRHKYLDGSICGALIADDCNKNDYTCMYKSDKNHCLIPNDPGYVPAKPHNVKRTLCYYHEKLERKMLCPTIRS